MIVRADVIYVGCKQESFKTKAGKDVNFQRVTFVPNGEADSMTLTALMDLDFSMVSQFAPLDLSIDFYKDDRTGYLKGKIVGMG